MGDKLFRGIISIIRLASYTLELLAVLQILYNFDHHNCAAKVQFYPLRNLAWHTYCWGHRCFVTCSVLVQHLYVTFYLSVWLWESSFLSVLVLLSFPRWQALGWLHSPFLVAMLTRLHLFGNFREGILFSSLPLSLWMQAIQNMYMQSYGSVKGRIPNKIAPLGSESVWVLICSLIKISRSKSCCLCSSDDSFFTTFCSLPSFLVASCLKKKKICCCGFILPWFWGLWYGGKGEVIEQTGHFSSTCICQHGYLWSSVCPDDFQWIWLPIKTVFASVCLG